MVPRPETPEPGDGGGDGAPSLGPSASDILVQPATNPVGDAATPTRRNRRPRDAGTTSANTAQPNDPAHLQPTGAFPREQDLESKYGPSSSSSLRRHVLSPAGGGRVVRRPVVERTLTRICTLALPPLHGSEDMLSGAAAARGTVDMPHAGNLAVSEEVGRTSSRQRTASGMSAGDAAAIAAAAAALTPADESDGRSSISSRMSHATGTTAPVTNTASSVANTTAVTSLAHDHGQQLEASFPPARPNFAPGCQPIIAFGRYVVAATDDGRVCLFAIKSFEENVDITAQSSSENNHEDDGGDWDALERMKERINRIEDERSAVLPVATVGPFRIGGGLMSNDRDASAGVADEFDLPGCIVALAATPVHVPLPTYRRRKKRRRSGDAEDEGDDDPPPPPPTKAGHSFLGHIAALTSEGDIHVLQVYESDNNPRYISRPFVEVLASFSTMTFCATCICIRKAHGQPENDDTSVPAMRICVGHDNGIIGEWEVVITCDAPFVSATGGIRRPTLAGAETKEEPVVPVDAVSAAAGALDKIAMANHHSRRHESEQGGADEGERHESNDATADDVENKHEVQDTGTPRPSEPKEPPQPPPLKYSIPRPRLMWAGQVDAPIRSISSLGNGPTCTSEDAELVQFMQTHVAIGLAQRAKSPHENPIPSAATSLPPSLAIEVVDSFQAEAAWQQARSKETDMSRRGKGLDPVLLFDFCTWPGIGMEIRDGSMIPDLQSGRGSDYMASRIDGNMVRGACVGLERGPGFAITVSDGTVAVSDVVKQVDGIPAWGIASNQNQVFLPGPPIGMGCFNTDVGVPTIAYCLQGGLVFAVPGSGSESSRTGVYPLVVLYQYPFDLEGDDDEVVRFAHGFVAGDVIVSEIGANACQEEASAVVGFSWAGGVMDIFGCGGM